MASLDGRSLPDFGSPPLAEVVLSAAFRTPQEVPLSELMRFWSTRLSDSLPGLEQAPPYEPPIEAFPLQATPLSFQFFSQPPTPRLLFVSADGSEVVQAQPSWFARTWRRREGAPPYPRYDAVRRGFVNSFSSLIQFLQVENVIQFTQCEVTYLSQIDPGVAGLTMADIDRVFRVVQPPHGKVVSSFETAQLAFSSVHGSPPERWGRLHGQISIQPGADQDPVFALNLTYRGGPHGGSLDDVVAFLDEGHYVVVNAFTDITSPAMHEAWKRLADRRF